MSTHNARSLPLIVWQKYGISQINDGMKSQNLHWYWFVCIPPPKHHVAEIVQRIFLKPVWLFCAICTHRFVTSAQKTMQIVQNKYIILHFLHLLQIIVTRFIAWLLKEMVILWPCYFSISTSIVSERSVSIVRDNQNEKEENVLHWKEKTRQAGQGDTGSVLELCEEIRPIVEDFCRSRTFRSLFSAEDTRSMASLAAMEFMMGYEC